jgi:hypothetical protein
LEQIQVRSLLLSKKQPNIPEPWPITHLSRKSNNLWWK